MVSGSDGGLFLNKIQRVGIGVLVERRGREEEAVEMDDEICPTGDDDRAHSPRPKPAHDCIELGGCKK